MDKLLVFCAIVSGIVALIQIFLWIKAIGLYEFGEIVGVFFGSNMIILWGLWVLLYCIGIPIYELHFSPIQMDDEELLWLTIKISLPISVPVASYITYDTCK